MGKYLVSSTSFLHKISKQLPDTLALSSAEHSATSKHSSVLPFLAATPSSTTRPHYTQPNAHAYTQGTTHHLTPPLLLGRTVFALPQQTHAQPRTKYFTTQPQPHASNTEHNTRAREGSYLSPSSSLFLSSLAAFLFFFLLFFFFFFFFFFFLPFSLFALPSLYLPSFLKLLLFLRKQMS